MFKCKAVRKDGFTETIEVPDPNKEELFLEGIRKALNIGNARLGRRSFNSKGYECITTLDGKAILFPLFKKPKPQKGRRRTSKFDRNFLRHRPMPAQQRRAA